MKPTFSYSQIHSRRGQQGMGLVEIMVGVLIGMIGVLAVFVVLQVAEERRRSVSTGSDAQSAAAVALFRIERQVALAGFGFGDARDFYNCETAIIRTGRAGGAGFTTPLLPVLITQGAGTAPDTLTVWHGNAMLATTRQSFMVGTPTAKVPEQGTAGFKEDDVVLVTEALAPAGACPAGSAAVVQVSAIPAPGTQFEHDGSDDFDNPAVIPNPGFLYNLGPAPTITLWSVGAVGNTIGLLSQDFLNDGVTNTMAAERVIDLQAQYGVDTAAIGADPVIAWTTDPALVAGGSFEKVVAIRVAVLVQSDTFEREPVTATQPSWTGGDFAWPVMADGTDPMNYRYRVYESVMPLRNVVWGFAEE